MSVRAKFIVDEIVQNRNFSGGKSIKLVPVTATNPENTNFYKWTPSGEIRLSTVNPAAAEQFILGKEYYIDFTLAE